FSILPRADKCTPLVITGGFADRFSGLSKETRPSELSVMLGDRLVESSARINTIPDELIVNPTYIGFHPDYDNRAYQGRLGQVYLLADRLYPDFNTRPSGLDFFKNQLCQRQ
ncbi:MAG: hypothetical protein KDI30_05340, partial [Pseudomonadales bacterium]|nr:hypothetical protein [Pseudomonadales bacterium]